MASPTIVSRQCSRPSRPSVACTGGEWQSASVPHASWCPTGAGCQPPLAEGRSGPHPGLNEVPGAHLHVQLVLRQHGGDLASPAPIGGARYQCAARAGDGGLGWASLAMRRAGAALHSAALRRLTRAALHSGVALCTSSASSCRGGGGGSWGGAVYEQASGMARGVHCSPHTSFPLRPPTRSVSSFISFLQPEAHWQRRANSRVS